MARLNWENVAAPDFSGSAQGIKDAAAMINQALAGARSGIADFQKIGTDRVNKGIMTQLALMDDSGDAAQIPGLLAGVDPSNLYAETLSAVSGRREQLNRMDLSNLELADTKQKYAEGQEWDAMLKGAAPETTALMAALGSPDPAQRSSAQAALADKLKGGDVNKVLGLFDKFSGYEGNLLGNAGKRQGLAFAAEEQGWSREDRKFSQEADELYGQFKSQSLTGEDFIAGLNERFQAGGISGRAYAKVMEKAGLSGFDSLGGSGSGSFGDMSGGGGGGYSPGGSTSIANGGSYDNFLVSLESGGNPTARAGSSSATGLHQFTNGTWLGTIAKANPAWAKGKTPEQLLALRTNPQYSSMVAEALKMDNTRALEAKGLPASYANLYSMHHFGSTKFAGASINTPMSSILTPEQLAANPYLKGKTKGQALDIWAARTGNKAADLLVSAVSGATTQTNRAAARMEATAGNSLPQKFFELSTVQESPRQTALRLAKENPGWDAGLLEKQIIRMRSDVAGIGATRKNVNSAIIGQAIVDNAGAEAARTGAFFGGFKANFFGQDSVGDGQMVDYDTAFNAVKGYATGKMDDTIGQIVASDASQGIQAAAQQRFQRAQAAVENKRRVATARGIKNPRMATEMLELEEATAELQGAGRVTNPPGSQLPGRAAAPAPVVANRPIRRPAPPPVSAAPQPAATRKAPTAPAGNKGRDLVAEAEVRRRSRIDPEILKMQDSVKASATAKRAKEIANGQKAKAETSATVRRVWAAIADPNNRPVSNQKTGYVNKPVAKTPTLAELDAALNRGGFPIGAARSQTLALRNRLAAAEGKKPRN